MWMIRKGVPVSTHLRRVSAVPRDRPSQKASTRSAYPTISLLRTSGAKRPVPIIIGPEDADRQPQPPGGLLGERVHARGAAAHQLGGVLRDVGDELVQAVSVNFPGPDDCHPHFHPSFPLPFFQKNRRRSTQIQYSRYRNFLPPCAGKIRARGGAGVGLKYFLLPKIIEVIPRNIQIIRWNSKSVKFLF